jgi:hypothetical protein
MNLKQFAKKHKTELIIGGIVVAGVTVIAVTKSKKVVPLPASFAEIAAKTAAQWEANGCTKMYISAGLLKDLDKYAKYLQDSFPDAMDKGVELIIGLAPDNKLMHVKSATTQLIQLA